MPLPLRPVAGAQMRAPVRPGAQPAAGTQSSSTLIRPAGTPASSSRPPAPVNTQINQLVTQGGRMTAAQATPASGVSSFAGATGGRTPGSQVGVGAALAGKGPTYGVGAAGGKKAPEKGPWEDIQGLQNDIMQSHQNAWSGIESGITAQNALNQSRNAEMNAAMGRNIGGGFWGGQAQVQLGTQQNLNNARLQWEQQGQNLQMNWLDKVLHRNERQEDLENEAARTETNAPTTLKDGSVDEILNRTVNGQNAWTAINDGIKNKGWGRSEIDRAKAFAAQYFKERGYWPSTATIDAYALHNGAPGVY